MGEFTDFEISVDTMATIDKKSEELHLLKLKTNSSDDFGGLNAYSGTGTGLYRKD